MHIDKLGFVWVNLASREPVAWEDDFAGVDEQERLQKFPMDEYKFEHEWGMVGDYNWKTLADNYNEVWFTAISSLALMKLETRATLGLMFVVLPLSDWTSGDQWSFGSIKVLG